MWFYFILHLGILQTELAPSKWMNGLKFSLQGSRTFMLWEKYPVILGTKIFWETWLISDNDKDSSFSGNEKSIQSFFLKQSCNLNMIWVTCTQPITVALKLDFYTSSWFFCFAVGKLLSPSLLVIPFDFIS